jgi:hypothetical protein
MDRKKSKAFRIPFARLNTQLLYPFPPLFVVKLVEAEVND